MSTTIGIITIGQTPRVDMTPAIRTCLPPDARLIEKGVLDGKSGSEIAQLFPEPGQVTLVSRLKDGGSAVMAKEKILSALQSLIDELNQAGASLIILACTGSFPIFKSAVPVIYPDYLLNHVVKGLFRDGQIGAIVPLPEQTETIISKWKQIGIQACSAASSPYSFQEEPFIQAVKQLDSSPIEAIVLDCIGYTEEMKRIAQANTTKPVILSRNIVYRNAAEIV